MDQLSTSTVDSIMSNSSMPTTGMLRLSSFGFTEILSCVVLLAASYYTWLAFFHPLSKVPGPFPAKFTNLWLTWRYFRGSWLDDVVALHEKYGPAVRIAPNELSFVDAAALKEVYGHGKPSLKTSWYHTWNFPGAPPGIFNTTDPVEHRFLRGRVSMLYSMSSILKMEPLISDLIDLNIQKLRGKAQSGTVVDLSEWVSYFTFDVVGTLAMGRPMGDLENEKDVDGITNSIHEAFYIVSNMGFLPGKSAWVSNRLVLGLMELTGANKANAMNRFIIDTVTERMENKDQTKRTDMLQSFISLKDRDGQSIKPPEAFAEAGNVLGAGSDTTAVGILACIGAVATRPEVYTRLQKEIDQAYEEHDLQAQGREINYLEASKLPYLSAIIRESTRLHPSIVYQLPRKPPQQGMQVGKHHIASSVNVSISAAAANRDKTIFGPDAASFNPDRWMLKDEADEAGKKHIHHMDAMMTTYGMGSRSCIGRNIAIVEMHKYVASFVRHFDVEVVNKERPWKIFSYWMAMQSDFNVKLKARESTF